MIKEQKTLKIGNNNIGHGFPVYFIADIAANHDGDLDRAKKLIELAKNSGADAAKFQHHDVKQNTLVTRGLRAWEENLVINQNGKNPYLKFIKMRKSP